MNPNDENHDPTSVEDLHDRLVDCGLAELIGNDVPPDLSAQIQSAYRAARAPVVEPVLASGHRRGKKWLALAIAAALLVAATILLLPDVQSARQTARGTAKRDRLGSLAANHTVNGIQTRFNESRETLLGPESQLAASSPADAPAQVPAFQPNLSIVTSQSQSEEQSQSVEELESSIEVLHQPTGLYALGDIKGASTDRFRGESRGLWMMVEPQVTIEEGEAKFGHQLRPDKDTELGTGPGLSGDQYTRIFENPFIKAVGGDAVSTFSIDVDTASYSNVRQFISQLNQLPPPDAVRIEELINYFDYDYAPPSAEDAAPFAAHLEVAACPWATEHRLVRIGIKGREMERDKRPQSNLVFLVDVSGSMNEPSKLPLVVNGLEQLARELGENDRVAIVVYASSEGLVLPSTPGSEQQKILGALSQLQAGGSTAGGAGIQLAYQIAEDHFIEGGTNRVILCTDGDFNVGVTSTAELERLVEQKAKDTGVFLSVLGFGRGNLNDAMMEAISNRGNGNYYYVDNRTEARRVLVEQMTGTLVTIAKDVKIQVEFNPRQVTAYRLLGYENRMLRTEDFNDDKKDAGEIGAGHTVTALYEIVPAGGEIDVPSVDELKYQEQKTPGAGTTSDVVASGSPVERELLTLKMRYKKPDEDTSTKLDWAIADDGKAFSAASTDFQFAAAVAGFGLLLRDSQYKGNLTYAAALELADSSKGDDAHGYRAEFVELVRQAKTLRKE